MYSALVPKGILIPNGFAVTTYSYFQFIRPLIPEMKKLLKRLDINDLNSLDIIGSQLRGLILTQPLPEDLKTAIGDAYETLTQQYRVSGSDATYAAVWGHEAVDVVLHVYTSIYYIYHNNCLSILYSLLYMT